MAGREPKSGSLSVTSVQQTTENARLVGRFHPPTSRSRQTKYRNSFKTTERREREGVADKILHLIPIRGRGGEGVSTTVFNSSFRFHCSVEMQLSAFLIISHN